MKAANLDGRLVLLTDRGAVDVERASAGRFSADPAKVYPLWNRFREWVDGLDIDLASSELLPVHDHLLGPPSPRPQQIFAIGLNYAEHAEEANFSVPDKPLVFTKFSSCLTGPVGEVAIPTGEAQVDWEVELVVVIGVEARHALIENAWSHVAGLTIGQDLSERRLQLVGSPPQFSLAKSLPGFGPTGPWLATPDEFDDPDDLGLECLLNGEVRQAGRTAQLVFSVPELVSRLSATLTLMPGDLIFTGTPSGVNLGSPEPRWLRAGDLLTTRIEGLGEVRQRMI